MNYFKHTAYGIIWMIILRVLSRGITFVRLAITARILTPAQFGTFGIASLILSFLEILTETGINVFIIQNKEKISNYINYAWIISISRGLLVGCLLYILSPVISSFFNDSASLSLLQLISIVPFIRGFINPAIGTLQKELKFNQEFLLRFSVFLFDSLVTVYLTVTTRDVSAFVWGLIAGSAFEVALSFLFIRPLPSFSFNINQMIHIIQRGKWVTIYGIFHYLSQEADNAVVGKILGVSFLGIYQNAFKLSTLPISEITDVVSKVVFPVYAKIADDKQRLKKAFIKSSLCIFTGVIVLSIFLFLFRREIVLLILGDQWTAVITIFQILIVYGMLRAIIGSVSSLFLAVGKQEYIAAMTFVRFSGLAICIIPLTLWYGIVGTGYAAILSVLIELPVVIYYTLKVFQQVHHEKR